MKQKVARVWSRDVCHCWSGRWGDIMKRYNRLHCCCIRAVPSNSSTAQYTPPTPTRRNCRVESRRRQRCEQNSHTTSSQRLPTGAYGCTSLTPKTRRNSTSLLANLSRLVETVAILLWIPYTPPTRLNSTVELRRWCVLGITWVLDSKYILAHKYQPSSKGRTHHTTLHF